MGPLLFSIYFNDLFYLTESTEVCNFADDLTFFVCDKDLKTLINRLEHDSHLAIEWFEFSTKKTFDEIVCRSPVRILPISLDVSW